MSKLRAMGRPSRADPGTTKAAPVSLAPLSFEQALKALTATPPMGDKPKLQPATRRKKPNQKKAG